MRYYDTDARSFHTDTASGVIGAWMTTIIPVVVVMVGIYFIEESPLLSGALVVVGGAVCVMFVLPMWASWLIRLYYRSRREQHESTKQIVAMNKEIELEYARRATSEALTRVSPESARLAREWMLAPPIRILETSVVWEVDGVSIPVTFAVEWYDKWQQRGGDRELPADRDWVSPDDVYRDLKRSYNRAIRRALTKRGLVRDVSGGTGGPFPSRFLTNDTDSALGEIGFWFAYELARMTNDDNN